VGLDQATTDVEAETRPRDRRLADVAGSMEGLHDQGAVVDRYSDAFVIDRDRAPLPVDRRADDDRAPDR
jgi:hypothetical protein